MTITEKTSLGEQPSFAFFAKQIHCQADLPKGNSPCDFALDGRTPEANVRISCQADQKLNLRTQERVVAASKVWLRVAVHRLRNAGTEIEIFGLGLRQKVRAKASIYCTASWFQSARKA